MNHRAAIVLPSLVLPPLVALATLTGCVEDNRRLTLGDSVQLDTFADIPAETAPTTPGAVLDRSSWPRQEFLVPVDGTAARPTWRTHPESATDLTHRQRGEYPTAETAVLTEEPYAQQEWKDAGRSAVVNTVDLALMPGRWFIYPATDEAYSPIESYDRAPWNQRPQMPVTGRPASAGPPPVMVTTPMNTTPLSAPAPTTPAAVPPASLPQPMPAPQPAAAPSSDPIQLPPAPQPNPQQQIPPAYTPSR
ncbi:MAG: hypothetical protein AAF138_05705 [Planctomycetota bacterium]